MPSVNLAPGTQYIIAAKKRRRRVFAGVWSITALLVLIWLGLFAYQRQLEAQLEQTENKIRDVQSEIARLNEEAQRVEQFEAQLASLGDLLGQHISWDPVLQSIETLTPQSVRLESLTLRADDGQVNMIGTTTDIDQVAQAIASLTRGEGAATLENVEFGSARRTEVGNEEEGVTVDYDFTLSFSFNPNLIRQEL